MCTCRSHSLCLCTALGFLGADVFKGAIVEASTVSPRGEASLQAASLRAPRHRGSEAAELPTAALGLRDPCRPRPPLLCASITHAGLQTVVKTTAKTPWAGDAPEAGSVPAFNGSSMRSGPWRGHQPAASVGKQHKWHWGRRLGTGGPRLRAAGPPGERSPHTQGARALRGQCPWGTRQGPWE